MERIDNIPARNLSYNKRKRGILRKAIELSIYCEQDIYLVIFDREKQKLVEFNSSNEFSFRTLKKMFLSSNIKKLRYEKYQNDDYDLMENDLSDKKFMSLNTYNRKADSEASEFLFEDMLEEELEAT